jgi:PAS domain S-box-containing protein
VPVLLNTYLIRDDFGKPVGRWSILHDITEKKRAEQALARERDLAKKYLDLTGFVFVGLDTAGKVTVVNRKACEVLGVEAKDAIGRDWIETWIPERLRVQVRETFTQVITGGGDLPSYFENPVIAKGGAERQIGWHNTVLADEEGKVAGTLSSGEDITERNLAIEATAEAHNKLRLLSRITSHDIQNQLIVLEGLIQKARREHSQIVVRELLARMQQTADRIQTHLTFAREYQNLGRTPPVWQDIDVVVRDLSARFESKFVQFSVNTHGLEVYADLMLNRVFHNLIDNTLKHGQKATRIEVSASQGSDGEMIISYRDDGVGVPTETKKMIFDRRPGYDGPQGLMLVSEILGITGIRIEEKGVPGEGALFEMTVPKGSYRFAAGEGQGPKFVTGDAPSGS